MLIIEYVSDIELREHGAALRRWVESGGRLVVPAAAIFDSVLLSRHPLSDAARERVLDAMLERGRPELPRIFAFIDLGSPQLRARALDRLATAPEVRCDRTWMESTANRLGMAFHDEVRQLLHRHPSARARMIEALHAAAEPRRQELVRRLNLAPGGTAATKKRWRPNTRASRAGPCASKKASRSPSTACTTARWST